MASINADADRLRRLQALTDAAGRVAIQRRPIVLPDVDTADVFNPILREKGIKSMLGVPLLVGGEPIGVLHVGTLVHRTFKRGDVELLELVAARVAIAIERVRLHEETVQLDHFKQNFVAIASHELRTPATAVYGVLATLAMRGHELSEETRNELVQSGYEQGERLRRLLEELLDLSRLDSVGANVEPKPVVLRSLLGNLVRDAIPPGIPVELDVPDDLAAVIDPLVLERVIANLLANAVRYGRPPITIVAQQRDRHLRVSVEDAGRGIPEELSIRLFERFARGEEGSGSGLGLAIARGYARAHGGDLIYDAGERGARFELIIPQRVGKPS